VKSITAHKEIIVKALRFGLLLTVVYALNGFFAPNANAQVVERARFTLPFEANWDGRVLPAGDYTLSVTRIDSSRDVAYRVNFVSGGKISSTVAVRQLGPSVGEHSALVVEARGKAHAIRELQLHSAGLVLKFREAKADGERSADRQEPIHEFPILVAEN
jgi:hypothetical protein